MPKSKKKNELSEPPVYRRTSAVVASHAGRKLRDPNSTPEERSIAASALVQRRYS